MKFSFKHTLRWSSLIAVITLVLAAILSIISSLVLSGVSIAVGMIVVFILVLIGIVFDAIGLATAAADEVPFHAMASERVHGSKEAILICRNAAQFSSFCNDVIGDISGIVSGTASAVVVLKLVYGLESVEDSTLHFLLSVLFTSVVAALTVGGKAMGKSFAILYATDLVLLVGKFFYVLDKRFHLKILKNQRKKKQERQKK